MINQIFYQSSLPRAGSTLLQNIMGQNPDFYVTPTSGVIELIFAARKNYSDSIEFKAQDPEDMENCFLSFCRGGLINYYNTLTNKPYIIDKSRGWGIYYNFLNSFYPNPRIICMVRDPRAIYSSMEKNFRKHPHKDVGIVNHLKMEGTTTEKRIDMWANSPPVGQAMERLYQILKEGIDKHMLFIKFEDLTSNPEDSIKRVYNYLKVPYYQHDFNNIEQITEEDDKIYGIFGDHKIRKEVKPVKEDYNQILGIEASNWIKERHKWFYEKFGF